jgi:uncharacterized membrane protein YphA (DoxX/SURF4 family)
MQTPTLVSEEPAPWSLPTRLAFRFGFVYLVLFNFPMSFDLIPGVTALSGWYDELWRKAAVWAGAHVLHLSRPVPYIPIGSDTLAQYIQIPLMLVLAVFVMLVWSVLDRQRREYARLHQWLRLYARLALGSAMLLYGADKVIKVQFPDPFLWRLIQPFGDSNPTGLLWTFMGYSRSYNIFTGLLEMAGGVLVIVPRLATLGAFISLGAMANVFMLNISYDVPVKIYSFHLLLLGAFLLMPELRRLGNIFILNRPAQPVAAPPLFRRKWMNVSALGLQLILLAYWTGSDLYLAHQRVTQYGDLAPQPPLYGIYSVDVFVVDGQVRPPLLTDEERWRRVTFDRFNLIGIQMASGSVLRYRGNPDLTAKTLQLSKSGHLGWKASFILETPSPGEVTLNGEMDGRKIQARLRKLDLNFTLYSSGIHWIAPNQ